MFGCTSTRHAQARDTKPELGRVALYTPHTTHHGVRPRPRAGAGGKDFLTYTA